MMKWLLELPDFPEIMESEDPKDAKVTILGRCRQFVKAGQATTTTLGAHAVLIANETNAERMGWVVKS